MQGYGETSYGDAMADVYDDWYGWRDDTDDCVALLTRLAGAPGSRVLELGAGTGRLALPLAAAGFEVHALDASAAMLARLHAKPGAARVATHVASMAGPLPAGPFSLVFVAVNTLFNLTSAGEQQAAFDAVAGVLGPGGRFVVEAFVPDPDADGDSVTVKELTADRVVLSVSRSDARTQRAAGQFVELRDGHPVRLRPWAIRWATPEQLDAMAAAAGMTLEARHGSWRATPYGTDSDNHVTIYTVLG